jgi:hypothetical protein
MYIPAESGGEPRDGRAAEEGGVGGPLALLLYRKAAESNGTRSRAPQCSARRARLTGVYRTPNRTKRAAVRVGGYNPSPADRGFTTYDDPPAGGGVPGGGDPPGSFVGHFYGRGRSPAGRPSVGAHDSSVRGGERTATGGRLCEGRVRALPYHGPRRAVRSCTRRVRSTARGGGSSAGRPFAVVVVERVGRGVFGPNTNGPPLIGAQRSISVSGYITPLYRGAL